MRRLDGKVAIITGGASGIGEATARAFVSEGARVVICDIDDARGTEIVTDLGDAALFQHLDVACEAEWAPVLAAAEQRFGQIDILVNDAGCMARASLQFSTTASFRKQLAVNQDGVFFGMREIAAFMERAGGGAIVNLSSTGGLRGGPGMFSYRTTKWAVRGMSRAAAHDLAASGIRVNTVMPGVIETPMTMTGNSAEDTRMLVERTVMRRMGQAREIAAAILFLASDEASYITGIELPVDGGISA